MSAGLSASSNTSAVRSTDPIRYYHVISVGVICFLIGAITSFVMVIHCQRITPSLQLDYKPAAAAAAVSMATAERRRDVMVTSRGCGATTSVAVNEKLQRTSIDDNDEAFSRARSSVSNCSSQTPLVHRRHYYRRRYTGGVADTTYCRT